ncbi:MAG: hypothetical protein KY476_07885 [Planctomycetes bacterium]|nr:hypothetical protein [Planctomycetota bacterium]
MTRSYFWMLLALAWAIADCLGNRGRFAAADDNGVPVGELVVERPTLTSLGFRWYLADDLSRNASVAVAYRCRGESAWKTGLPFLQVGGEWVGRGSAAIEWHTPQVLAGSILDLEPGTEYEIELKFRHPDGGRNTKSLILNTRLDPRPFAGGRTRHIYPPGSSARKNEPAYDSLAAAYAEAVAGDVLLVHAGVYTIPGDQKKDRRNYVLDRKAPADRPIVIRAAGDGEAVLDGTGALRLIDCQGSAHLHLEGLTLRGADHLVYAGRERGSTGLVVRRCRLEGSYGVFALHPECRDFYIADNVFLGPHQRDWHEAKRDSDSQAVWLSGQGHVVCYNRVRGFWDGLAIYGRRPPDDRSLQNCAIDFYNNDLSEFVDDAIELDYGVHNLRCFRNRIANTFMGISAQPVYGGPAYIWRNVMYNTTRSPLKPNQYPAGLLFFHNTCLAHGSAGRWAAIWQNSQILNNLFLGTDGGPGVIWTGTLTPDTSRLDYNGWHFFRSGEPSPIWWQFVDAEGKRSDRVFPDLPQFVSATGHEQHGVVVDYEAFVKAQPPSGTDVPLPELDLRLKPGGRAVDAGTILPNLNDGYTGQGPDLGAYEVGQPVPRYGPRS